MINDQKSKNLLFLKSSFARKGVIENTEDVLEWLKEQNAKVNVNIKRTAFSQLDQWGKYEACSCIKHSSGKFFSIDGIEVNTNWGNITSWHQPIINQPEVGYLGIIVKEFDGVLHFLMQAKIEPGNINYVQLSPTLQATRSNYLQVHKGKNRSTWITLPMPDRIKSCWINCSRSRAPDFLKKETGILSLGWMRR